MKRSWSLSVDSGRAFQAVSHTGGQDRKQKAEDRRHGQRCPCHEKGML